MKKNFAIIGCGGFIAPRHLRAIKDTGNVVIAALDKTDSVGLLDSFFDNVHFFTEFERFDRHAEKIRRKGEENRIHFVSICSPNYLHDAHIRFAFRIGADAICEKPLVINPWNLKHLEELEKETGRRVYNVLQLRCHPSLTELKKIIDNTKKDSKYEIELTYITPRGKWYDASWKGDAAKSGGLETNLGIHFFDMLIWIFGNVISSEVHYKDNKRIGGFLELEKARVKWFLSIAKEDIPNNLGGNRKDSAYRMILINGKELEFSDVFAELHTEVYKRILNGDGFGIKDAKDSIEITHTIRNSKPYIADEERMHKLLRKIYLDKIGLSKNYYAHPNSEIVHGTEIGKGTKIWAYSKILPRTKIGENCIIGSYVEIGPDVSIGNRCKIQNNVSIYKGVILEDDIFCGPSMVFTNVLNPRAFIERKEEFVSTVVKKGATIGANATVIGDVTIGEYTFIGAGAVVTKNTPDYSLILGIPGRQEGWVCKCGEVLTRNVYSHEKNILKCERCQEEYEHFQNYLKPINKQNGR